MTAPRTPAVPPATYYRTPAVRHRVLEYAGALRGAPSCAYFAGLGGVATCAHDWAEAPRHRPDRLDALLETGADVARSLWDTRDLLFCLDVDYLNVDYPGEAFLHPADVFLKLEPTYRAARRVLRRVRLPLSCLMTGRGYHFVGRVPLGHALVDRCARLVPEPAARESAAALPWSSQRPDARQARAHAGLGVLLEYLAHAIVSNAASRSPLPVVLNGTVVGTGVVGRECVSLDLSHAGDPLETRHLRSAFSTYQWHRARPDIFSTPVATSVPPLATVPRRGRLLESLALRASLRAAARLAARCRTRIPVVTGGVTRLLEAYEASTLAAFHRAYHAIPASSPDEFPAPRVEALIETLPPCAAEVLRYPNDLLLRPAELQHLVRLLLSKGWPSREIAGLVHARYRADAGWGTRWMRGDPAVRAEFDVRVFAGLVACGLDRGVDFNCTSAREKDLCPPGGCARDLRTDRDALLRYFSR
jgi:hypothetical protein